MSQTILNTRRLSSLRGKVLRQSFRRAFLSRVAVDSRRGIEDGEFLDAILRWIKEREVARRDELSWQLPSLERCLAVFG